MKTVTSLFKTILTLSAFSFFAGNIYAADYSVKFIRVVADQVEDKVLVRWGTVTEINNEFFTVQRSVDGGGIWQDLGDVPSSGNVPGSDSYQFVDENPTPGSITYRLRQTDYDGTYSYSFFAEVLVVLFTEEEEPEVELYPNPTEETVSIITENFTTNVDVKMMDLAGKLIQVKLDINDNQIDVSPVNKLFGMYFLLISDERKTIVKKVKFE